MNKTLRNTAGFSVLIIGLLIGGSQVANTAPSDKDVQVVNTTAQPVPTAAQGTTTIAGNVGVTGSVAVTNTVGVNVLNAPTVHVVSPAVQPFQQFRVFSQNGTNVDNVLFGTVPSGKRLVIEYIAFSGQVPAGTHVETMDINTIAGGNGAQYLLPITQQPDAVNGDAIFNSAGMVKIYADPGTSITSTVRRSTATGTATYGMSISGHLEDL